MQLEMRRTTCPSRSAASRSPLPSSSRRSRTHRTPASGESVVPYLAAAPFESLSTLILDALFFGARRRLTPMRSSPFRSLLGESSMVLSRLKTLTAAAVLARAGMEVTVLEAHIYPGGCAGTFYHQGYRFDAGATLAGGFYPGGPMDLVAQASGVSAWPARSAAAPPCSAAAFCFRLSVERWMK